MLTTLLLGLAAAQAEDDAPARLVVHAERVYTGAGQVLEGAAVVCVDGKIAAVGGVPGGGSDDDRTLRVAAVTPGLIDLGVRIDTGLASVEQSSELQPDMRALDAVDWWDLAWDRQLRSGVTTVLLTPADRNVIGGLGAVVKTGGPKDPETRVVRADAVLRGAIGREPSAGNHPAFGRPDDHFSRRPTTRMGVEWEWRKAFFDAAQAPEYPELEFDGAARLRQVLAGDLLLSVQAWNTQDIRTAVYLKEEMEREGFGSPRLVIDAAAEAWKEPQFLVRSDTPVVLPPFTETGRSGESSFLAWNTAAELHEQGVRFALSSHGSREAEARLPLQAGFAMRGGLPFDAALAAVTSAPARMVEVFDRVGSLAVGKDADLVLWSGAPFEPTSRVVGVVLDGRLVVEPEE